MSSEESYLAILRYLTNEREPYAPGTEGNAKRKIRKAAACYVVRSGILYYQRRHRDKEIFTELEVVLQTERRKGLIDAAHIRAGGEHLTRHQTWHNLSQSYWWRGILKHVKDYIKACPKCQERLDRSRSLNDPSEMLEELGIEVRSDGETDDEQGNSAPCAKPVQKTVKKKPATKHELVFVDSKGTVRQSSTKHGQKVLEQLNQQRLSNQFCDVTLLIEGEEFKAHKSVLAASSEYFRELFIEKGAVSSHEAFVDLSGFCKSSFLPLLEFAYTSDLSFDFCTMAEVAMLARHLYMSEVLEICESVHKQMEEKQLTLYHKGDVQTVTSEKSLLGDHVEVAGNATPTVTEAVNENQAPDVINKENMECEVADTVQMEARIVSSATPHLTVGLSQLSVDSTVELVSESEVPISSLSATTAIYISDVNAELQPAVIIPAVIDVSAEETQAPQTVCIAPEVCVSAEPTDTQPEPLVENVSESHDVPESHILASCAVEAKVTSDSEQPDVNLNDSCSTSTQTHQQCKESKREDSAIPVEAPCVDVVETVLTTKSKDTPPKRKRGRPPKSPATRTIGGSQEPLAPSDDSTYKRKLRERSVGEGGYVQMHKGQEKKIRKTNSKSAVQQVAMKLVLRGKKRIMPSKKEGPKVEDEHKCAECGMVFQRRYALIMHSVKHDKIKEFKCPLCTKEFQYRASLRAHLIRHTRKPEACIVEAEMDPAEGPTKRQFICDICGRTLPKLYSLRLHMLRHTGVKPHACKICEKTFTHKHGLKMHQALHEAQKRFKCDRCEKSFVTKRSLQEHVSTHTGISKYLCSICGKAFHRASGLSKHIKKHKPRDETCGFHCTQCDKSFFGSRDLQQHMNKHLGVKPFECEFCGKCYSWKKDWYSHVKSHSVTEPYKCNVCGKEFYEKSLFRRHVNKATHGKKGRTKQNVERVCEHCGKTFTQLREYRRHINNHEGVKPFECLTCGVAWADARSLKRHVRTHTGERPYVCPVCNEAYIDARTLRKHMTKFHNNYVPCKIMLEKDTLQFHNQGTQVEHAVNILSSEMQEPHAEIVTEEIETVLVTGEAIEDIEAVSNSQECVSTLSDQSIMQVVNYVLAQQQGQKIGDVTEHIETVEVEVDHISEEV
ncbi:zinc finger and BTB domain-containing protein 11 [Spea bombifrons]|uniref:zinc finger and BTB domain-containing protein 11 n=1 Tax=Spea bombifrons TaxID=233779 RepID=UPI002349459D|nr:zinc finger and BTB domain-containing protein 11 [Spea bombifrons]